MVKVQKEYYVECECGCVFSLKIISGFNGTYAVCPKCMAYHFEGGQ